VTATRCFYTADLHLGHERIIELSDRPFGSVGEMNLELVERWNATVGDQDEIWVLGDLALGSIEDSLVLAGKLRGRKMLVTGNHDRCWPGNPRWERWIERYAREGFRIIHSRGDRVIQRRIGDRTVQVSHFPYTPDHRSRAELDAFRPADSGGWLIHGHAHNAWRVRDRQVNVGVDIWDYAPVSEERLARLIDRVEAGEEVENAW
jgi:calcineurin-like phosphoesterase family protein